MKPCEIYKDLILTNYIDGELDLDRRAQIDAHLRTCAACRELVSDIKKELVAPLEQINREEVPDAVWTSIKERIENESTAEPGQNWLRNFLNRLYVPRFVPVLAGLIVIFVVGISFTQKQHVEQQAREKEQVEYMASLVSPYTDDGLGTAIEEYFL